MKKANSIGIILMTCLISFNASAVQIRGIRSCSQWITNRTPAASVPSVADETWLLGFLSGMAFESEQDLLSGTDNSSIFMQVTNFCKKNPLKNLANAADDLTDELAKKKGIDR